jgi:hypothetical protein
MISAPVISSVHSCREPCSPFVVTLHTFPLCPIQGVWVNDREKAMWGRARCLSGCCTSVRTPSWQNATTGPCPPPELVASFQECRRGSPWPGGMPRAADESGAGRNMRGTLRQGVGRHARDRCMFCPRALWMSWSRIHAISPHTSRGSGDWENSQPVHSIILPESGRW